MTLLQGMLGTIIFWSISTFLLLNARMKINFIKILPIIIISIYTVLVLYSAKTEYRAETWLIRQNGIGKEGKREIRSSPDRLFDLISERITNPSIIFSNSSTLNMVQRINQAFQVVLVMKRVPTTEPFANGEMTILRPISALVPRIFWPEKPLLPDPADYKRFTGVRLSKYNSVTIGPIGEAYADFGKYGIIFLFFYGLVIKIFFTYFRKKSENDPYWIIWFLIIMSGAISHTETTVAGSLNGYIKLLFFIFIFINIKLKNILKQVKIA
jgi:Ca2+/Na+ antiporter